MYSVIGVEGAITVLKIETDFDSAGAETKRLRVHLTESEGPSLQSTSKFKGF
ncbi:hypothetical protein [Niallia nealsonii]|uniref:hypothetical protein n=1 Tax=Niallia nealsonii TaxID=115979 RepID=UPI0012FF29A2|nr:hypothetical protein [Niallia nealsonii]